MPYVLQMQIDNINDSLQIGDTVYYTSSNPSGGFNVNNGSWEDITKLGTCSFINRNLGFIRISGSLNVEPPGANSYLFFSKDKLANLSSVKGYYAEVKMINNEYSKRSELFQIALGADISSK